LMNAFAKVLVVLVLLLSAGFAASQMLLYSKRANWRAKFEEANARLQAKAEQAKDLSEKLEIAIRQRDELKAKKDAEIARLKEDITSRELQIAKLEREKENLQDTWNTERQRVNKLEERLDAKDQQIDQLKARVAELGGDLKDYMARVEQLQQELRERQGRIEALDAQVAQLEKEKRQLTQERDNLETVIAGLEERGIHVAWEAVPVIDAKVIRVDNQLGTAVLNKGKKDNVKVGYPFVVYRGNEFVAKVYVLEVTDTESFARVDRTLEHLPLSVGDDATTRIQ